MGSLRAHIADHRCGYLLASLVAFLISGAFTKPTVAGQVVELVVFLLVLITGVASMAGFRRARLVSAALAVPFVGVTVAALTLGVGPEDRPSLVSAVAILPFLGLAFATTFAYTIRRAPITPDRLFGAAAAFLLMGVAWSSLYSIAELASPGSFRLPPDLTGPVWNDLMYFSLVTQTTLGYGDITPSGYLSRTLAVLQACAGLFYMGAIVAYLVAAQSAAGWSSVDGGPSEG